MPSKRTMVRHIQRKRVFLHIPKSLSTFILSVRDDLKTTIRAESIYAFESDKEDPNCCIVFTTTQDIDELEFSSKRIVDGTFAVSPSFFYLLHTMHGDIMYITPKLVHSLARRNNLKKVGCV